MFNLIGYIFNIFDLIGTKFKCGAHLTRYGQAIQKAGYLIMRDILLLHYQRKGSLEFYNNKDLNASYIVSFSRLGTLDDLLKIISTIKFN
jgi:hypothetical protein